MERMISFHDSGMTDSVWARVRSAVEDLGATVVRRGQSRVGRGVAWSIVGNGFSQGGSFLSSLVVARVLGREFFGQFALIQSTVTVLTTLASLGVGLTATKYIAEYRASRTGSIGELLGLSSTLMVLAGLFFSCALGVGSPLLAVRAGQAAITAGFRLSTIAVFFLTLSGYQTGVLAGFENFRSIARTGMICGIANPMLTWWSAVRFGLEGGVAAQGASAFLLWLLYGISVKGECQRRGIAVEYRGAWGQRSILTSASVPAAVCGIVISVAVWGSNGILVRACGYSELALLTAASNLRSVVLFLPALIFRVASPRLSHLFATDPSTYSRCFWEVVGVNSALAFVIASIAFLRGHQFVRLFGKNFAGSNGLLALILTSVVIEVVATNLFLALLAGGRFWWNLGIQALWATHLLVASAFAAPRYGAAGVAMAYLSAWSMAALLYSAEALKQVNYRRQS